MKIVIFNNTPDNDYSFLNTLARGSKTVITRATDFGTFRSHMESGEFNLGVLDLGNDEGIEKSFLDEMARINTPLLVIGGRHLYSRNDREKFEGDNQFHLPVRKSYQGQGDDLEAILALVATLSHEINNPLQAISSNVEILLEQSLPNPIEIRAKLRKIGEAVARIREVLDHLMALEALRYHEVPGGRMLAFEKFSLEAADQNP